MTDGKLGSATVGSAGRYIPLSVAAGLAFAVACGNTTTPKGMGSGSASVGGSGGSGGNGSSGSGQAASSGTIGTGPMITPIETDAGDDAGTSCTNLLCQTTTCTQGPCTQKACAAGTSTTMSGTVFDPAGKVPLYNVVVWVPNEPVPAIKTGASCDLCGASIKNPVASALTDNAGKFTLTDVPVGDNIPVVIQVGKWRRQITVPHVAACVDTPLNDPSVAPSALTADQRTALQTRLPRNQTEGDIPLIALSTGSADSMECLPRRMGLDDAEFTTDTGTGRIHLFAGNQGQMTGGRNRPALATSAFDATLNAGAAFTPSTTLWGTTASLSRYDIVILSCEGDNLPASKPAAALQAMYDYESAGGRVFASHWHNYWFSAGPAPVPTVATWQDLNDPDSPTPGTINTTFPKGLALSQWLVNVGASTTAGQLDIYAARDNVQAVNTMPNMGTEWITVQSTQAGNNTTPNAVEYMSYNAPLGVDPAMQCGRAVYTDLHVSAMSPAVPGGLPLDDTTGQGMPFPTACVDRDLSPQEKAVEFMLFDLSSCVQSDTVPPAPPPVVR